MTPTEYMIFFVSQFSMSFEVSNNIRDLVFGQSTTQLFGFGEEESAIEQQPMAVAERHEDVF